MAEMIGIRLQLSGASETASGLRQVSGALEDTAAEAGRTATALQHLPRAAAANVDSARATSAQVQTAMSASSREMQAQANMLKQANRNLSLQMTDVVTSLASGMPPHMVLIQQGGQIKDAYGGVGEALKGVLGFVKGMATPLNLAGAAIATLGVAAFKGAQEMDAFEKALVLTGNAIGMTSGQLDVMARKLDETTGATQGRAAAALATLAAQAGITSESIGRIAEASIAMERAGGPSVDELAKKFGALGDRPVEALVKLNEAENFLTESVYAQIRALQDQGRESEAAAAAQAAYADVVDQRARELEARLGYLERAWRGVKDFAKEAWDSMLGIGRKDSDEKRLAELQKDLDERLRNQASARSDNRARYQPGIDAIRTQIKLIEDSLRKEREQQELRQRDLDRAKARAAWDQERIKFLTQEQRLEEEIARIRKQGAEAGVSARDIEARVRAARERLGPRTRSTTSGQKVSSLTELGDLQALRDVVAELEDGLDILADVNDERARGVAVLELEQAGLEGNAAAIKTYGDKLRDTLDNREWQRTVDQVGQSLADALMTGGRSAGEALKRYFSSLILQPIIRAIVDPVAQSIVRGLGLAGIGGLGGTAAAAGGGGLSIFSAAQSLSSLYGAVTGSTASMLGKLIGGFGRAIGSSTIGLFGTGMQGALLAPGLAGPTTMGAGGALGAGAGMAAALPWLAGLGALAALWQPLFGRKLKDRGIEGSFGPGGFTGQSYEFWKGGLFRSDKTYRNPLDAELDTALDRTFNTLRAETIKMASDLGLASDAVATFAKDVKLSFMGLTQEQIQEKLAEQFGDIADEMARLVAGGDATAESLRTLYQAVMQERAQLEQRLLDLQGNTAEIRRRERDALHESNRALYDRVIALQDEREAAQQAAQALRSLIQSLESDLSAAQSQRLAIAQQVITERDALEARLLQAQGRTEELQARQIAALDPLNQAFARFVAGIEATAQRLQALAQAGQGIAAFVATLQGGALGAASTRSNYLATLGLAQGGDIDASGQIVSAAQAYLDTASASAGSAAEVRILRARIASELQNLPATQSYQAQQALALQNIADATKDTASNTSATGALNTTTGDVADSTSDTFLESEKQVTELRKLVSETIINSTRLSSLNTSIESLTNALTAANERERVAGEIETLQAQGQSGAADLTRLGQQYETARTAALQQYVDVYGSGWPQEVLEMNMPAGLTPGSLEYLEALAKRLNDLNQATSFAFGTRLELPTSAQVQAGEMGYRATATVGSYPSSYITNVQNALIARTPLRTAAQEVEALRQQIRDLGGVPAFARGGLHTGGMRLVGERGPELEVTGPARYWSAADTTAMLGNATRREEVLAAEIRALRAELQGLRAEARVTAVAANKTQRLWERVTRDGESMQITDVTPTP